MNDSIDANTDADTCAFVSTIAKAIGHPTRMRILRILLDRTTCICGEIVDDLGQAQSTVSQHLKTMRDAGLIRGTVDGPRVCYCLDLTVWRRFQSTVGGLHAITQATPPSPCCTQEIDS